MSRMEQVMQVGMVEGNVRIYIEDYAYTYLKKQKGKEKTKYFLYGEKEEQNQQKKLYIYGITPKPKMEQTYFKEYYPLGFLKIKEEERFWVSLNGQEEKIKGFYVFYAPNQAMQEYLVDHHETATEDKNENKIKRQATGESLPVKEILIPKRKIKIRKKNSRSKNDGFLYSCGGIVIAVFILFFLTSANGQRKLAIFKQVITDTVTGTSKEETENDIIIEETNMSQTNFITEETIPPLQETEENSVEQNSTKAEENLSQDSLTIQQEEDLISDKDEDMPEEENVPVSHEKVIEQEKAYEEYVVKEGDTLEAICRRKYGSLSEMKEICAINKIKDADYIAPGQKLYLPQ